MKDYNNNQFDTPAVLPLTTQVVYSQISNLTVVIGQDIGNQSSFCIRDWLAYQTGEFGKLNEVLAINGTLNSIARLVVAY